MTKLSTTAKLLSVLALGAAVTVGVALAPAGAVASDRSSSDSATTSVCRCYHLRRAKW